jgi:multidrug resistance efflux pump
MLSLKSKSSLTAYLNANVLILMNGAMAAWLLWRTKYYFEINDLASFVATNIKIAARVVRLSQKRGVN